MKKSENRAKKRGPIIAAIRNQNLMGSITSLDLTRLLTNTNLGFVEHSRGYVLATREQPCGSSDEKANQQALSKVMRADPQASAKEGDGGDQARRTPSDQCGISVGSMNVGDHLGGVQACAFDVLLQLAAKLRSRLLHLLSQNLPSSRFSLLNRIRKFCDSRTHFLDEMTRDLFED
jgi:hypothetical protein